MSRLSIRARLTLVFVVVMAVVLAIIGAFLYFRTKNNLDDSIAESLRARQGAARAYVQATPAGRAPQIPPGESLAQLLSPSGKVIASRPQGRRALLTARQIAAATHGAHIFEWHEYERYLAGPARVGGQPVIVVVGTSLSEQEHALEGLGGALLVGGPLALLLAAAIGYSIAAGALRPVEEMRRRAETISSADPTRMLPEPEVDDELRRLSVTLNEMLRRIARSAAHERRFIANASHELRTPLAALQAELEIAERHATSAEELRAAIARGRQDVARLIRLSNGLLELAVTDERSPAAHTAVRVDDVLAAIAGDLRHRVAEQDRELVVEPSGLTVVADGDGVRRAVTNLIENALVHGAGTVTAAAAVSADGNWVEIRVHDEGSLDPSVQAGQAFERFARGADAAGRPGAGLGLSLVQSIAAEHGGSADLAEAPGGGIEGVLRLPRETG